MMPFFPSYLARARARMDLTWSSIDSAGMRLVSIYFRQSGIFFFFFYHSVMPNAWGRTFIALISKKPNPKPSDYCPISLCNVCYKIISKILANRLKNILPGLSGREQCGFVNGRTPFDNIITFQEVAHSIDNDNIFAPPPPRMLRKHMTR